MMENALIFVVIVGMFVLAAVHELDRFVPPELHLPLKVLWGGLVLVAILQRLFPVTS